MTQNKNIIVAKEPALIQKMTDAGMNKEAIIRELSHAKQLYKDSPILQKCEPESLLSAVVNVANIGLTLNPAAKESYIVPRYDRQSKGMKAHLMPSYIGFIKLIIQEGCVSSVTAQVVYEKDDIQFNPSDNINPIVHKANPFGDRGKIIGFYALATLKDGTRQAEAMSAMEVNEIRDNSESWKNENSRKYSPWAKHYSEMGRKTVIRRIFKYLPRGEAGNEKLFNALELDNQDHYATFQQIEYIEHLLKSASVTPERSDEIYRNTENMTFEEAKAVIRELKDNQVEDIRYTGTGMIQKGKGSTKENLKNAIADEKR